MPGSVRWAQHSSVIEVFVSVMPLAEMASFVPSKDRALPQPIWAGARGAVANKVMAARKAKEECRMQNDERRLVFIEYVFGCGMFDGAEKGGQRWRKGTGRVKGRRFPRGKTGETEKEGRAEVR